MEPELTTRRTTDLLLQGDVRYANDGNPNSAQYFFGGRAEQQVLYGFSAHPVDAHHQHFKVEVGGHPEDLNEWPADHHHGFHSRSGLGIGLDDFAHSFFGPPAH